MLAKQPFESVRNSKLGRWLVGCSEKALPAVLALISSARRALAEIRCLKNTLGATMLPAVGHENGHYPSAVRNLTLTARYTHVVIILFGGKNAKKLRKKQGHRQLILTITT